MTSFSIFIASTMQSTWPGLDLVALGDLDGEHGALHRADDGVAAAPPAPAPPRSLAAPRELRAYGGSGTSSRTS